MKWIAYNDAVYGPFNDEAAAEQKAKVAGWRSYDICDSQAEAQEIVDGNAEA